MRVFFFIDAYFIEQHRNIRWLNLNCSIETTHYASMYIPDTNSIARHVKKHICQKAEFWKILSENNSI